MDPVGRRLSQYRQMSGGRFLVSLREVRNTERILSCRSLIKNDINFWKEDLQQPERNEDESYEMIDEILLDWIEDISESVLDDDSSEVATSISGYIAKMLLKRSKCKDCEKKITMTMTLWPRFAEWPVLNFTFKRKFICTTKGARRIVCSCFAILDFVEGDILSIGQVTRSAMYVLKYCNPKCEFCCQYHLNWGIKVCVQNCCQCLFQ